MTDIAGQLTIDDALGLTETGASADTESVSADTSTSTSTSIEQPTDSIDSTESTRVAPAEPEVFDLVSEAPGVGTVDGAPRPPEMPVKVTRSKRRRKTAQAQMVDSVLHIRIPAACTADEEQYFIDHFKSRFERSCAAAMVDLDRRAGELANQHGLPQPTSIRWVSNQQRQWGSCTPADGTIRLSDRMAGFPRWVVDYVIMHELAHLVHADHGPAFWELVNRYPLTERARGYLLAKDGV
jgi:hypothetical protein